MGNFKDSSKTPLGTHEIAAKYGKDEPYGTIFAGTESTNQRATIFKNKVDKEIDFVTSRILHLQGTEEGINRGGNVDSFSRFIYIHGTAEEGLLGTPYSKGCVRMNNNDVIELFEIVPVGTLVEIIE